MSQIKIAGIVNTTELHCIGFGRFANQADLNKIMPTDFMKIASYADKGVLLGKPLCICKSFNYETKDMAVVNGFIIKPNKEALQIVADGGILAIIPAQQYVLKVIYYGSYTGIEHAWMKGFEYIKANGLQHNFYTSPWEVYVESPTEHQDNSDKYVTEIYIPLMAGKG